MKKALVVLLILVAMFSFVSCGKKAASEEETTLSEHIPTQEQIDAASKDGKVHIVMWDNMSGDSHACTQSAAEAFNASQDIFEVEVLYTSSIMTKMLTSTVEDRPNIVHSTGNDSAKYIALTGDDALTVPVQIYIDYDNYDMSSIVQNLATNYTRNGEWQCVPYGNTSTGYYYNLTVLNSLGIDVDSIKSYEDLYTVAKQLVAAGYDHPIWFRNHVDYLNFGLTSEGITYFNEENGHTGTPTASYFAEGECYNATLAMFQWLHKMAEEDLLVNIDVGGTDARNMFGQGDIIIYGGWSSGYDPTDKVVQGAFEFCFRPTMTIRAGQENKGQSPGGACMFICDVDDPVKEYGSWLFIKFFMQDEWTSAFAMASGYVPITMTGAQTPTYQEYIKTKNPSAAVILEAQNSTPVGLGYALLPYTSDYASAFTTQVKKVCTDLTYTPEQAMTQFISDVNDAISMYWLSQGVVL